jgi:uncharacterized protein (TIGR04255 family)
MERFAPLFHDAMRAEMPHRDNFELQQMQVEFGPDGVKTNQTPLKIWQIASPDRKFALILTPDSLSLHTNSYREHQSFIDLFERALTSLIAVPEIGIKWMSGVALRYVNVIVPPEGEDLARLLVPSVLPPTFSDVADLKIAEGIYVSQYHAEGANVRFQLLRNPRAVMPPDIDTPLLRVNKWTVPRPTQEFAVVDTDCSATISVAAPLDLSAVRAHMYRLRFVAKAIFEHIGTEFATSLWKGRAS